MSQHGPDSGFEPGLFAQRRRRLIERLGGEPFLLLGTGHQFRNMPSLYHRYRQDSTFLYFTGWDEPGSALLWTGDELKLFAPPVAADDAIWHGPRPSPADRALALGLPSPAPPHVLEPLLLSLVQAGRVHTLPTADARQNSWAAGILGAGLTYGDPSTGSNELAEAVIGLRILKDADELAVMRKTMLVTSAAHQAAMSATRPGATEPQLAALVQGVFQAAGCVPAYGSIVTRRGEILHQMYPAEVLRDGDLLLLDAGAESGSGYATDVTRTWPVSGRFTPRQARIYDLVLAANRASTAMVRPGVRYRDVHIASCRVIAAGLVEEGLLRGDPDQLVADGAHALFFPHGVGHLLGLDVHDLEDLGDRAGYAPGRTRSEQFGLGYLRLDRDLEAGCVVTIEPGIYFSQDILQDPSLRRRFASQVDFSRAEEWMGFGGIRIEDDVVATDGAPEVLSAAVPVEREALEEIVGTGPNLSSVFGGPV